MTQNRNVINWILCVECFANLRKLFCYNIENLKCHKTLKCGEVVIPRYLASEFALTNNWIDMIRVMLRIIINLSIPKIT